MFILQMVSGYTCNILTDEVKSSVVLGRCVCVYLVSGIDEAKSSTGNVCVYITDGEWVYL